MRLFLCNRVGWRHPKGIGTRLAFTWAIGPGFRRLGTGSTPWVHHGDVPLKKGGALGYSRVRKADLALLFRVFLSGKPRNNAESWQKNVFFTYCNLV
jgi:hypothetical protein